MMNQTDFKKLSCSECAHGVGLGFDFSMAFQPIVNVVTREIFGYEALVRGRNNEPAGKIFELVNETNRYRFDQACRVTAIKTAAEVGVTGVLSINFMPEAIYRPELCIRTTLEAAKEYGFPIDQLMFEASESEKVTDPKHMVEIFQCYDQLGFRTAIDDFGAAYSGLSLLANFPTDYVKLDMSLNRNIDQDKSRRAVVRGIFQMCSELDTQVIAEGIETFEEMDTLRSMGIELFQGYYFARPGFESTPHVSPEAFR